MVAELVVVVGDVESMAVIDNEVFVVTTSSSTIKVYDAHPFMVRQVSAITVEGLKYPFEIVACHDDRQLYVVDIGCIWRVSVDDHSYVKWMTTKSSTDTSTDKVNSSGMLSLTSRRLLMTSSEPPTLHQYNTVDGQLLRVVQLPQYMKWLYHAVETTRGTFVVAHSGTSQSQDKLQHAVS